jgi:hypothetical protein
VAAGGVGQGGSGRAPFDHARTSSRAIAFSVSLFPFRIARKSGPFLSPSMFAACMQASRYGVKVVVTRHLVALTALLMQPKPGTFAVFEIVFDAHSCCSAHAREGENHDADHSTVAKSAEFGHVSLRELFRVELCPDLGHIREGPPAADLPQPRV